MKHRVLLKLLPVVLGLGLLFILPTYAKNDQSASQCLSSASASYKNELILALQRKKDALFVSQQEWATAQANYSKIAQKAEQDYQIDQSACRRPYYDGYKTSEGCLVDVTTAYNKVKKNALQQLAEQRRVYELKVSQANTNWYAAQDNAENDYNQVRAECSGNKSARIPGIPRVVSRATPVASAVTTTTSGRPAIEFVCDNYRRVQPADDVFLPLVLDDGTPGGVPMTQGGSIHLVVQEYKATFSSWAKVEPGYAKELHYFPCSSNGWLSISATFVDSKGVKWFGKLWGTTAKRPGFHYESGHGPLWYNLFMEQ